MDKVKFENVRFAINPGLFDRNFIQSNCIFYTYDFIESGKQLCVYVQQSTILFSHTATKFI